MLSRNLHRSASCCRSHQAGATLAIALVVLAVLMLSGVAAMHLSNTQFRLAGNLQYQNAALNQAETAVAAAESWLATGDNFRAPGFDSYSTANSQLYPADYLASRGLDPLTMTWQDGNSMKLDATGNQRYLIEMIGKNKRVLGSSLAVGGRQSTGCNMVNVYRISARGASARGAAKTVQSVYTVKSC
jgi:Tfp pilus assembly protein PilX